jgi:hypothetical protein
MLRLYYKIWVDCITRLQQVKATKDDWKKNSMIIMSFCMSLNLILLILLLPKKIFSRNFFYGIQINGLSEHINFILTVTLLYILPCVGINYLLIFRAKNYEKLVKKYSYQNGKLIIPYLLISAGLPIILFLYIIFMHIKW